MHKFVKVNKNHAATLQYRCAGCGKALQDDREAVYADVTARPFSANAYYCEGCKAKTEAAQ
jgi:hypothetical protein